MRAPPDTGHREDQDLTNVRSHPVSEPLPGTRGEPEDWPLAVLGVAHQHASGLRLRADFDAVAAVTAAVTGLPPRRVHIHQLLSGSGPARLRAGGPRILESRTSGGPWPPCRGPWGSALHPVTRSKRYPARHRRSPRWRTRPAGPRVRRPRLGSRES